MDNFLLPDDDDEGLLGDGNLNFNCIVAPETSPLDTKLGSSSKLLSVQHPSNTIYTQQSCIDQSMLSSQVMSTFHSVEVVSTNVQSKPFSDPREKGLLKHNFLDEAMPDNWSDDDSDYKPIVALSLPQKRIAPSLTESSVPFLSTSPLVITKDRQSNSTSTNKKVVLYDNNSILLDGSFLGSQADLFSSNLLSQNLASQPSSSIQSVKELPLVATVGDPLSDDLFGSSMLSQLSQSGGSRMSIEAKPHLVDDPLIPQTGSSVGSAISNVTRTTIVPPRPTSTLNSAFGVKKPADLTVVAPVIPKSVMPPPPPPPRVPPLPSSRLSTPSQTQPLASLEIPSASRLIKPQKDLLNRDEGVEKVFISQEPTQFSSTDYASSQPTQLPQESQVLQPSTVSDAVYSESQLSMSGSIDISDKKSGNQGVFAPIPSIVSTNMPKKPTSGSTIDKLSSPSKVLPPLPPPSFRPSQSQLANGNVNSDKSGRKLNPPTKVGNVVSDSLKQIDSSRKLPTHARSGSHSVDRSGMNETNVGYQPGSQTSLSSQQSAFGNLMNAGKKFKNSQTWKTALSFLRISNQSWGNQYNPSSSSETPVSQSSVSTSIRSLGVDENLESMIRECPIGSILNSEIPARTKIPALLLRVLKVAMVSDANAVVLVEDPSGIMSACVSKDAMDEYRSEIISGSVILVKNCSVFCVGAPHNQFINIIPANIVKIWKPDTKWFF